MEQGISAAVGTIPGLQEGSHYGRMPPTLLLPVTVSIGGHSAVVPTTKE